MSKLYDKYLELKKQNFNKLYLLKSGIFYIALDADATILSKEFGFKLIPLNDKILKCGFPQAKVKDYVNLLNEKNINFEIVQLGQEKIENISNYIANEEIKNIIQCLSNLDMNEISYKQAFELLFKLANKAKIINI